MFDQLRQLDSMGAPIVRRMDDVSLSAFVSNQLLDVIPQVYDRRYVELDAAQHIPVGTNGVNPAAMSWAYDIGEGRGSADFLGANARDIPRADVSTDRKIFPIRTIVSSYGWTLEEIEAARWAGVALDVRKGMAARRAISETDHTTLLNGNASRGIPGFLTNTQVPIMTVPNGAWGTPNADNMVADLNAIIDYVFVNTKKVHRVTRIALPNAHFRRAQTTRLANTTDTVLAFVERTNPGVTIRSLTELATAGPSGAPRAIGYDLSPDTLTGVVPLGFDQLDPQMWGMETVIPVRERVGGTVWYYPMGGVFVDGLGVI